LVIYCTDTLAAFQSSRTMDNVLPFLQRHKHGVKWIVGAGAAFFTVDQIILDLGLNGVGGDASKISGLIYFITYLWTGVWMVVISKNLVKEAKLAEKVVEEAKSKLTAALKKSKTKKKRKLGDRRMTEELGKGGYVMEESVKGALRMAKYMRLCGLSKSSSVLGTVTLVTSTYLSSPVAYGISIGILLIASTALSSVVQSMAAAETSATNIKARATLNLLKEEAKAADEEKEDLGGDAKAKKPAVGGEKGKVASVSKTVKVAPSPL